MANNKQEKLIKQIKVRVEWTDETFDFVEFVERVVDFKKKASEGFFDDKQTPPVKLNVFDREKISEIQNK